MADIKVFWNVCFLIFVTGPVFTAAVDERENFPRPQTGKCILPQYPENGNYAVHGAPYARPGQAFQSVTLNISCYPGYVVEGADLLYCYDGFWNAEMPKCVECGRITPQQVHHIIINGTNAKRGELPWHAGIYSKVTTPYMQICGGSLVSTNVVISAAHCFWNDLEKKLPASNYAVAVGKLYRSWNNPQDLGAQKSDVSDIKIPPRFQGSASNFQDDIALVILTTIVEYKTYVRPVCLDFDFNFDRRQLQEGEIGKVAGWGLTAENGQASPLLQVVNLPYVEIEKCIAQSSPAFQRYITSDKICAGYEDGTALCKGDSGGGLAFPDTVRGTERFYLRGIASTAPNNENLCNSNTFTYFTQVAKHEHFIKEALL